MSKNEPAFMVHYNMCPVEPEEGPDAKGFQLRKLLDGGEGPKGFGLRYFEIEAGGASHTHHHVYEQANYVISGRAILTCDGKTLEMSEGCAAYIPPHAVHRFSNAGSEKLVMLGIRGA
ncbi:MAG: cupin domain-containing protein [Firmicutes bacterium]|nr:cupin domain-containing protein [Bacillota bacterium]